MYRNYDGHKSMFGSISVSARVPDPDTLASFAALRQSDGALTVMVVNKALSGPTPVALSLAHFSPGAGGPGLAACRGRRDHAPARRLPSPAAA